MLANAQEAAMTEDADRTVQQAEVSNLRNEILEKLGGEKNPLSHVEGKTYFDPDTLGAEMAPYADRLNSVLRDAETYEQIAVEGKNLGTLKDDALYRAEERADQTYANLIYGPGIYERRKTGNPELDDIQNGIAKSEYAKKAKNNPAIIQLLASKGKLKIGNIGSTLASDKTFMESLQHTPFANTPFYKAIREEFNSGGSGSKTLTEYGIYEGEQVEESELAREKMELAAYREHAQE